jgi:hypothetical protein
MQSAYNAHSMWSGETRAQLHLYLSMSVPPLILPAVPRGPGSVRAYGLFVLGTERVCVPASRSLQLLELGKGGLAGGKGWAAEGEGGSERQ